MGVVVSALSCEDYCFGWNFFLICSWYIITRADDHLSLHSSVIFMPFLLFWVKESMSTVPPPNHYLCASAVHIYIC